jgi:hypothetical protein
MKRLFFPALFFPTLLLTTTVAAQNGGDWSPSTCHHVTPSTNIARESTEQQLQRTIAAVKDVSQCELRLQTHVVPTASSTLTEANSAKRTRVRFCMTL